jgi:hypothetical protein
MARAGPATEVGGEKKSKSRGGVRGKQQQQSLLMSRQIAVNPLSALSLSLSPFLSLSLVPSNFISLLLSLAPRKNRERQNAGAVTGRGQGEEERERAQTCLLTKIRNLIISDSRATATGKHLQNLGRSSPCLPQCPTTAAKPRGGSPHPQLKMKNMKKRKPLKLHARGRGEARCLLFGGPGGGTLWRGALALLGTVRVEVHV